MNDRIYVVGTRYQHHAAHSGYEGFCQWVGNRLELPLNFREAVAWKSASIGGFSRKLIQKTDELVISLIKHPGYSLVALLTECVAAFATLKSSDCIFHILYGDTDLCWLGSISRIKANKLIATFHQPPDGMEMLKVDHRITKDLAAAIIVSESQRNYLAKLLPQERIFKVPHGVDTDFFHPAGQLSEEPICITVGSHWRDFYTLEQAIYKIWETCPQMHFIAVGTERYKDNKLEKGLNITDPRVQLVSGLSDEQLRNLYQKARIAVFSFWDATANNALLEAMACGLPIVATDIGGIQEYVGNEAGLLCSPYDSEDLNRSPEAMAKAVLKLLENESLAKQMGAASRSRALIFDYKTVADQMKQVYSKILIKEKD